MGQTSQVFLRSIVSKKEEMQLRNRDIEWWMERRQLPRDVCQRVRRYERHRWAALRGVEESDLVNDLPDAIRRDIKRHLCLQLVRSVMCTAIILNFPYFGSSIFFCCLYTFPRINWEPFSRFMFNSEQVLISFAFVLWVRGAKEGHVSIVFLKYTA